MKTLFFGGQKSGKSSLAEAYALEYAQGKTPYYVATYNAAYNDDEMAQRIAKHRKSRDKRFKTVEAPYDLHQAIKDKNGVYVFDCITMWLFNTLDWGQEAQCEHIRTLLKKPADMIFVLNDVGSGIIPIERLSRTFVDRSGIVGQILAQACDNVYEVKYGMKRVWKMKNEE
jgi:adenosylcobinamide kinase/adenosylcobinamide-phosphate guanylyltransferase